MIKCAKTKLVGSACRPFVHEQVLASTRRAKADHSLLPSSEIKNTWIYISITPIRLHGVVIN